jgi:hypothetical protein
MPKTSAAAVTAVTAATAIRKRATDECRVDKFDSIFVLDGLIYEGTMGFQQKFL